MIFFVIPYLLAVDLVVPPGRLDYKPSFYFNIDITSIGEVDNAKGMSSDYKLTAIMSCTPDPISLWCCISDTKITHGQHFKDYFELTENSTVTSITDEPFLLEFDKNGVKISSCNETSERSLRMLQKIVDLLNVDVDFDGERRGHSRLETITVIDDCPITTKANFQPIGKTTREPGDGTFKLMSHPDEFDETSEWILDVNRMKDFANCKNTTGYFFGSRGENDVFHGSKLFSNVTSLINHIKITNDMFVSTSQTEGTMTSSAIKFTAKETITVSITINDIYVPK